MPYVCRILALRLADATRFLSLAENEHWPNGHSCLPPSAFGHWVSAPLHDSNLEEGYRPRKVRYEQIPGAAAVRRACGGLCDVERARQGREPRPPGRAGAAAADVAGARCGHRRGAYGGGVCAPR